jgi:glycosyltransferase involved in cell wall biosynthesis
MKKVILVVLNNFINDSRVQKEAVSLKDGGYDVKVVALHEGALAEHETIQGVEVHRIKLKSRSWSKNKIVQLFKYVELIYKFVRLYGKADIIHCNDLNTLPLGVVVKTLRNRKAKIVYDAHEYETELNGLHGIHKKITKIAEKMFIGFADKVLTVGNTIAEEYVRLYGIAKPAIILNAPSYKTIEKKNIFRKTFGIREDQTIFLYQGGLTVGRGIEVLLDTFEAMGNDKGVIVFMGYGYLDKLIKEKAEKNNNIFFHPAVTPDVLLNYTSSWDFYNRGL